MFLNIFNLFQIAVIIKSKIFCIHGGICPKIYSLDDIRKLDRKTGIIDVINSPLLLDILTSQPDEDVDTFTIPRKGTGYLFGEKALDELNRKIILNFL